MYEFVTHTWNAIKGKCPHDCSYCYMKRWGNLKDVRLDEKELKTDLGTGNFIFVGSSCDMFAADIPDEWILKTLNHCVLFKNKYLIKSKNPQRIVDFYPLVGVVSPIVCTTIETNRWYPDVMGKSPSIPSRVSGMRQLNKFEKFVTEEPIMDFDILELVEMIKSIEPTQVNIGADSGGNNLPEPSVGKIEQLKNELSKFTTVANKRNIKRLL